MSNEKDRGFRPSTQNSKLKTEHSLAGKHITIIGAAGGIGAATVRRFAQEGARLLLIDRDAERLHQVARDLGEDAVSAVADAADRAEMEAAFALAEERWGGVDAHIHVAGLSGRRWGDGPIDECTQEGWDVVMRNNLDAVYLSNQLAARIMKRQKSGCIVNVSSVLGLVGAQEHFVTHAYASSRGAVISLSRAMAAYYARFGIRVNCVCSGLLDTPMSQRALASEEIRAALIHLQPLPPHIGNPEDVAEAIVFLAGDSAKFITGVVLPIDGGWTAT